MKLTFSFTLKCIVAAGVAFMSTQVMAQQKSKKIDYVNPFIGTGGHGHTYPGATVPFGMVQLSPDNGTQGWDWCSGYHYSDSVIAGFSHTHLSGTGIGDLADISVMPTVKLVESAKIKERFSHQHEKASPGYYSVDLLDSKIKVELSASQNVGWHRYTFPKAQIASIRFDLGFAINWDAPVETFIKIENDSTVVGYRKSKGWSEEQWVFFAARLNKKVEGFSMVKDGQSSGYKTEKGKDVKASLIFSTNAGEEVLMKVAISSANIEGALKALDAEKGWDFDQTRKNAEQKWEHELNKIDAKGSENDKIIFYTAMYHAFVAPNIFSDLNGNYKGPNGKVNQAKGFNNYTVFSLWDTFRAANPLYTITQPERVPDFINSFLAFYDEYSLLPIWPLVGSETNCMTGNHAIPVIADAILKGFKGFDQEKAFEAMKKSAMQNVRGTDAYRQYKYLPQDKKDESVTITLEYSYDDWCIAQVAKKLGKEADYKLFMERASYYANLFDKSTGFMRAKNSDGQWIPNFDPYYSEHGSKAQYTEGNAWQHSWFVPHDPQGLINLFGGKKAFVNKLDSLFSVSSEMTGKNKSPDVSGFIGQYAHGNEPSHHIAYLYNYAGEPWKAQKRVREILTTMYSNKPDGLSGNEDCGQMSAWYVMSAMGIYPVNPASGYYVFGSPILNEAKINLQGGKSFVIKAENNSKENIYIQSVTLNGKPYAKTYITHNDIIKGGSLVFTMGKQPNTKFGSMATAAPPSMSVAK
ncbi:GH92 family glycosyl hydrolase [Solitalea lacus]|uniref:GH92 family glycosyl hydrolase n=1 Tax=Solitalea lacus TaxID=2911172 RepID=UPI001EDAB31D|nr:GH92 family glycosyl hydrolase [Solitalea lacus]UKJ07039.1 GH92 family glycosyl hydrolase [Solitalea lacus]